MPMYGFPLQDQQTRLLFAITWLTVRVGKLLIRADVQRLSSSVAGPLDKG